METVTETNRQSSQVDRQVGRGKTDRQSGRRTGGGETDRQSGRQTGGRGERDMETDIETGRQPSRQTGGEGRDTQTVR